MDVHQNAWLTPRSRAELVRRMLVEGQASKVVAAAFGVTVKTVNKRVGRFQTERPTGLSIAPATPPPVAAAPVEVAPERQRSSRTASCSPSFPFAVTISVKRTTAARTISSAAKSPTALFQACLAASRSSRLSCIASTATMTG
jgi:hypothetical protein